MEQPYGENKKLISVVSSGRIYHRRDVGLVSDIARKPPLTLDISTRTW